MAGVPGLAYHLQLWTAQSSRQPYCGLASFLSTKSERPLREIDTVTIMHRTERVFILAALLFVGLGLMVAIGRGVLGQGGEQYGMLLWIMAGSLILVGAAGAL